MDASSISYDQQEQDTLMSNKLRNSKETMKKKTRGKIKDEHGHTARRDSDAGHRSGRRWRSAAPVVAAVGVLLTMMRHVDVGVSRGLRRG